MTMNMNMNLIMTMTMNLIMTMNVKMKENMTMTVKENRNMRERGKVLLLAQFLFFGRIFSIFWIPLERDSGALPKDERRKAECPASPPAIQPNRSSKLALRCRTNAL